MSNSRRSPPYKQRRLSDASGEAENERAARQKNLVSIPVLPSSTPLAASRSKPKPSTAPAESTNEPGPSKEQTQSCESLPGPSNAPPKPPRGVYRESSGQDQRGETSGGSAFAKKIGRDKLARKASARNVESLYWPFVVTIRRKRSGTPDISRSSPDPRPWENYRIMKEPMITSLNRKLLSCGVNWEVQTPPVDVLSKNVLRSLSDSASDSSASAGPEMDW